MEKIEPSRKGPQECRAVQLAVARLHQTGFGVSPVATVEAVQDGYDAWPR